MKEWLKAESPKDVAEFYDRKYKQSGLEAFTGGKFDTFFEFFEKIFGKPRPTDRLLDCGCGHGEFFERVIARYKFSAPAMTGVDVSPEAIKLATDRFRNYPNDFDFRNGTMDSLKDHFLGHTFDVVTSWGSIEHSFNPAEAFRGMLQVLKPGGIVMLTVPLEFEGCLEPIANEPFNKNNERFMEFTEWFNYFAEIKKPIYTQKLPMEGDMLLVFLK